MTSPDNKDSLKREAQGGTRRSSKRQRGAVCPIETANRTTDEEFIKQYLRPSADWTQWTHPSTQARYTVKLCQATALGDEELESCFDLIDETSASDYRASSLGWHPMQKKEEMRLPELRYVLVKNADGRVKGFTSLMPTFEYGFAVVYCYEIHLTSELQGTGLGRRLMQHLVDVAHHIPDVEKVMLTCFTRNKAARRFYDKMGFQVDEASPAQRQLRGGRLLMPDYVILSRGTVHGSV